MDRLGDVLSSEGGKETGGQWDGGGLQPSTTPSRCESTEQKGGGQLHGLEGLGGLRGPHERSSGAAHRAGCLGSAGGTPLAAADL